MNLTIRPHYLFQEAIIVIKEIGLMVIVLVLIFVLSIFIFRYFNGTTRDFNKNVSIGMSRVEKTKSELVNQDDINHLPPIIQKYLLYTGIIGKEKPDYFKLEIDGEMRLDRQTDWAPIKAKQVTFLDNRVRLFYIKMKIKGITINGLHHYENAEASMEIKLLDLIELNDSRGEVMNTAETVTYFNDICIFAPANLIDADIEWEEIDSTSIKGIYTNNDITVSAILYFNQKNELINFVSDDRYAIYSNDHYKKLRWSTPIGDYKDFDGYCLASTGHAIWHYDDEDFSYIKMNIIDIDYDN